MPNDMAVNNGQGEAVNPILAHPGLRALLQQQIAIRDGVAPANTPPSAVMPASSVAGPVAPPISLPAPATEASGMPSASPQSTNEAHLASLLGNKPALENVYHKITSSDFGQNHPVLGKLAGVAAQVPSTLADVAMSLKGLPVLGNSLSSIGQVMPGTTEQHNAELERAQNAVNEETANNEKGAQTAAMNERVPLEAARAEQAATTNLTREKIAGENNEARENIAGENNQTKEEIAAMKLTPEAHDAFHEWMSNPADYEKFQKAMSAAKAKPEGPAKNGGFMSAFAAVRALQLAYTHNPDLLPVLAPVLTHVFQAQGIPMPANAQEIFGAIPGGQPRSSETGKAIGTGMPESPTGATRSRGQFAESVLPSIADAKTQIGELGDKLGPMSGRYQELFTGKIGTYGPEFSGLQQTLHNIGTAWMRLHANSESARQDFLEALRGAKDPANLIANLDSIDKQARDYVKQGKGNAGNQPAQGGGNMIRAVDDKGVLREAPKGTPLPKGWKLQ